MVNIELLNATIKERGIKQKHLAERMGVTYVTYKKKMRLYSPFTVDDVVIIQNSLNLSTAERDNIFFA